LFLLGAFSPEGSTGWLIIGLFGLVIGFVLIYFGSRIGRGQATEDQNVTLKIDLPGNVNFDSFKCKSCGGNLTPEHVKMVAGAPVVTCPYCKTSYQLTEDPKW
jgi:hypothetical protein